MATPYLDKQIRLRDNVADIMLLVTQVIATPDRASLDALYAAVDAAGVLIPRPTYSVDGQSYQWESYLATLDKLQETLSKRIQALQPYQLKNRGYS